MALNQAPLNPAMNLTYTHMCAYIYIYIYIYTRVYRSAHMQLRYTAKCMLSTPPHPKDRMQIFNTYKLQMRPLQNQPSKL